MQGLCKVDEQNEVYGLYLHDDVGDEASISLSLYIILIRALLLYEFSKFSFDIDLSQQYVCLSSEYNVAAKY